MKRTVDPATGRYRRVKAVPLGTQKADPVRAAERELARENARLKRRIDQDLCDRARHLAGFYPLQEVARTLGLHPSQISAIKKRGWMATAKEGVSRRERPADLQELQATMTFNALCNHYRCGNNTMLRWLNELPERRPSWRGDALRNEPLNGGPAAIKSEDEVKATREQQWATRRARYGQNGYRTAAQPRSPGESE